MANTLHKFINLPNRTYQAVARSEIKKIALNTGFSKKRLAEVEIVVAEITSNLVKHATAGGYILVKQLSEEEAGLELIGIDNGPGMVSVSRMMEDGVSSTKTMGQGLGAIKRLSDDFDIYSTAGWGTIILSRIYVSAKSMKKKASIDVRGIMLAKEGETNCGDNYDYVIKGNHLRFAISDGLGHGDQAHTAAVESLRVFRETIKHTPCEQLRTIHRDIRKSRGAVMGIAHIDFNNKQMFYCGVGNISAKLLSIDKYKSCISYNGIVGHSIPNTMNNHLHQWAKNDVLIVHSDGLSTRWDMQKYPGITKCDHSIVLAALYKDHNRGNDDVTIVAIAQNSRVV